MKLSIIIVNYNVKHFIEQCLFSVLKATKKIKCEIIVVDNNSVDGSVSLIKEKFSEVLLIENRINTGFSVANNQGLKIATGQYVLLLNPDTVIPEDTFDKIISFMDTNEQAGGLGVKMVDGKGNYLAESKRGLPTPAVAFYKIFGLSKLFPYSKKFGQYHLTFLDKNIIHQIDILSGAFMFLRKKALEKTGFLDETFFMYGEDIDLSYRLQLAGYKNYYFPETCIIHYKGESTKKSSVNYVFMFYRAMIIFAKKHFTKNNAGLFTFLINIAIYLRAALAIITRLTKQLAIPCIDFVLSLSGIYLLRIFYEKNIKFIDGGSYQESIINIAFPTYVAIWLIMVFINGGYDKPIKIKRIISGILVGTGIILIIYSLLPETYRFSRALILLGTVSTTVAFLLSRVSFHLLNLKSLRLSSEKTKRIAVVASSEEFNRINELLKQTSLSNVDFIGFVSTDSNNQKNPNYIGNLSQIDEVIIIYKINEIIFCALNLSSQDIIDQMLKMVSSNVDFKIAPAESFSIIGSNSIETAGDLYTININSISRTQNVRKKRILDIIVALIIVATIYICIWKVTKKGKFLLNIISVLKGSKSWVGYNSCDNYDLPKIKKSVLTPAHVSPNKLLNYESLKKLNLLYSKDYKIENDLKIIWKGFNELGN